MNTAEKRVLEMVEQKKITADEGKALLAAMREGKRSSLKLLIDPYARLSTHAMLAGGVLIAVLSVLVVKVGGGLLRFDGFLDMHISQGSVGAVQSIADQFVAWPLSALVLWLVALAFERKSRFVDFLAFLSVARCIYFVTGVLTALVAPRLADNSEEAVKKALADPVSSLVQTLPMMAIALVGVAWFITALVFGFRHASGLRGARLAGAFILALIAAEVVSLTALWAFSKAMGA